MSSLGTAKLTAIIVKMDCSPNCVGFVKLKPIGIICKAVATIKRYSMCVSNAPRTNLFNSAKLLITAYVLPALGFTIPTEQMS